MLDTRLRIPAPDDFYEALIAAHQGLTLDESHAMNARLVLLLANQVGDLPTLRQALQAARGPSQPASASTTDASRPATPVAPAHTAAPTPNPTANPTPTPTAR